MNSNPHAKVVLCYGDSNTWGQNDDKNTAGRYPADVRWTGQLQKLLGEGFYVIEEGLGGRTIDLDHYNPDKPLRNGLTYFTPCLISHSPVDLVVIMLGTNDLKMQYGRSAAVIAETLGQYIDTTRAEVPKARILLVSPIYIDDAAPKFKAYYHDTYDTTSAAKSRTLARCIEELAEKTGSLFFDASTVARAGQDGIHFDKQSHSELAKALAGIIKPL